jgi:hypothetical protein
VPSQICLFGIKIIELIIVGKALKIEVTLG